MLAKKIFFLCHFYLLILFVIHFLGHIFTFINKRIFLDFILFQQGNIFYYFILFLCHYAFLHGTVQLTNALFFMQGPMLVASMPQSVSLPGSPSPCGTSTRRRSTGTPGQTTAQKVNMRLNLRGSCCRLYIFLGVKEASFKTGLNCRHFYSN